jgi:hypothetical protein
MGWGGGAWGLSPWGSGTSPILIVGAEALATRIVRVTLDGEPRYSSAAGTGDARNPETWGVERVDTGAVLEVALVERVSALVYDVHTIQRFGSYLSTHLVKTTGLLDATGAAVVPSPAATFRGLVTPESLQPEKPRLLDLANLPAAKNPLGGTLQIGSSGDYKNVSGSELVRKLLVRRLVTRPGEFFHLPNYGIGFRDKEPLPIRDLPKLKAEVLRQVLREPEIAQADVGIILDASGTLTILVRGKLRQGSESFSVQVAKGDLVSL